MTISQSRKLLVIAALVSLIFVGQSVVASAEQLVLEYSFDAPDVIQIRLGNNTYDRIVMPVAPNSGNIGQPALPARGAQILLPFGSEVVDIEIIADERVYLGNGFFIEPVGQPIKLSADPADAVPPAPDQAIYSSDQPYPGEQFQKIGLYSFRGYQVLTLKLQPVQYLPAIGELYYFPNFTVIVNTEATGNSGSLFRGQEVDDLAIRTKVDNPDQADTYAAALKLGDRSYDMLIITTTSLANSFIPLKDYHDATGLATEIRTTDEIGSSDPDDIRDYIRDAYLTDGIEYVIIGADDDIIPAKDLYVRAYSGGAIEYNMPSDIYFACLDGTYNYDGDSYWGEPNDGDGGGDVDLIAEVYVGRASVGNTTEADRFVNKTIQYITQGGSHLEDVQMVGEHLGFGGESEYAAWAMDELIDGTDTDGYTTVGIPSDYYTIDRLYDRDEYWSKTDLANNINSGRHIVNHLGHGSPNYAMKFYNSDVTSLLNNTDHCFVYSQTCLAGHLDGTDCWAETINIKTDAGAWAVIMNARSGWGAYNDTDGPSQRFNREFWDAVFNNTENLPEIGKANQDSKEDNLYRINDNCMRWCTYELNLFGDPSVEIKRPIAVTINFFQGAPSLLNFNEETSFQVHIFTSPGGVIVEGSELLHYSVNGHPWQEAALTFIHGARYQVTLPALQCEDVLEYYISAQEETSGTHYNPALGNPHAAVATTDIQVIFEDDFETSKGWTTDGFVIQGAWDRGVPVGNGDYGDPTTDFDGSGQCYLTENNGGESDVDGGPISLLSPSFDLTGGDAVIEYALWYSNSGGDAPNQDEMYVYISANDGTDWTLVQTVGPDYRSSGEWYEYSFTASDFVTPSAQMKLRFEVEDAVPNSVVEAAVDAVKITYYTCDGSQFMITTLSLPDWTEGYPYSVQLEVMNGVGVVTWSDLNDDLTGTGLTLSSTGLLSGIPSVAAPISFTASAADEASHSDSKELGFTINPAITITTTSLPDWTEGIFYSQQLLASGGTGTLTWNDRDGDLVVGGLTLSSTGLLSGIPVGSGVISFTAQASDQIDADADKALGVIINQAVSITTDGQLPDGTEGEAYSLQLECIGGTGTLTFSDLNGDLDGTGLTLSAAGLLSGSPGVVGEISFTTRAQDDVGSVDEKPMSFTVDAAYICGDADGNDIVEISDAVFVINFVFVPGSPAPDPLQSADVDCNDVVEISDAVYLISYIFIPGSPAPCADCP